jgi:hypothetical protein
MAHDNRRRAAGTTLAATGPAGDPVQNDPDTETQQQRRRRPEQAKAGQTQRAAE